MNVLARTSSTTTRVLTVLLAALAALLVSVTPASAASQVQHANCNKNVDTGARSLVVVAPKIWSNNGRAQTVRYRSQVWKVQSGSWVHKQGGVWRSGTAYPNTAWQDAARTWDMRPYGAGTFAARVQVQYWNGSAWVGTENAWVLSYHVFVVQDGRTYYFGAEGNCTWGY